VPALPGSTEVSTNGSPSQVAFQAIRNGVRSACLWVRWRAGDAVPTLSIDGGSGAETVDIGTDVTASVSASGFTQTEVLFYDNSDCAGDPLYQAPGYLRIVSYQAGFTGSFQAAYTNATEDFGQSTIAGYAGSCIPVTWAAGGLGETPATPIPGTEGPILVDAGTASGSTGEESGRNGAGPVTALPNTGAGAGSSSSFPWIVGVCLAALATGGLCRRRRRCL
jgi:hypothetical protein